MELLSAMASRQRLPHQHVAKRVHVVLQRAGVPYEVERQVCTGCSHVLVERQLKRTAA
jgi:hypothetical protein